MKIERDQALGIYAGEAARAARTADSPLGAAQTSGAASQADGVTVSAEARMAQSVLKAATAAPEIRQDVVDRMRALVARDEVGQDPGRLADAIIDHWMTKS